MSQIAASLDGPSTPGEFALLCERKTDPRMEMIGSGDQLGMMMELKVRHRIRHTPAPDADDWQRDDRGT